VSPISIQCFTVESEIPHGLFDNPGVSVLFAITSRPVKLGSFLIPQLKFSAYQQIRVFRLCRLQILSKAQ
jgi:hypothetical protein